jgi:hypothetical protein
MQFDVTLDENDCAAKFDPDEQHPKLENGTCFIIATKTVENDTSLRRSVLGSNLTAREMSWFVVEKQAVSTYA